MKENDCEWVFFSEHNVVLSSWQGHCESSLGS